MILEGLKRALTELGVNTGDVICVSSDISTFGVPSEAKELVRVRGLEALMDSYIETFQSVVGEAGGVLMPTFTYSATKEEVFDVQHTPSTVGALTEHFRKFTGVLRSAHPIFSYAGWGKGAQKYLTVDTYDCFGESSIFGKMCRDNVKYILLGIGIEGGTTCVYYSEQKAAVHYRYFKEFTGIVRENGKERTVIVRYFVRDYSVHYRDSWSALEEAGLASGVIRREEYNGGPVTLIPAREFDQLIQREVRQNPYFLIELLA